MKLLTLLVLSVLCLGCGRKGPPTYGGKSLRYWEAQAANASTEKRRAAATALGEIGVKGLPTLLVLSADNDHLVAATANVALIRMGGPKLLPELTDLIHDPDTTIRSGAAKLMMNVLVDQGRDGVPPLIELLKDSDPVVRVEAAKAFARIPGDASKPAIPALREAAADESPAVQRAARMTLQTVVHRRGRATNQFAPAGRP